MNPETESSFEWQAVGSFDETLKGGLPAHQELQQKNIDMTTQEAKQLSQYPHSEAAPQIPIDHGPQQARDVPQHSGQRTFPPPEPSAPKASWPLATRSPQQDFQKSCFAAPYFGPPVQAETQSPGQHIQPVFQPPQKPEFIPMPKPVFRSFLKPSLQPAGAPGLSFPVPPAPLKPTQLPQAAQKSCADNPFAQETNLPSPAPDPRRRGTAEIDPRSLVCLRATDMAPSPPSKPCVPAGNPPTSVPSTKFYPPAGVPYNPQKFCAPGNSECANLGSPPAPRFCSPRGAPSVQAPPEFRFPVDESPNVTHQSKPAGTPKFGCPFNPVPTKTDFPGNPIPENLNVGPPGYFPSSPPKFGQPVSSPPNSYPPSGPPKFGPPGSAPPNSYPPPGPPKFGASGSAPPISYPPPGPPKFGAPGSAPPNCHPPSGPPKFDPNSYPPPGPPKFSPPGSFLPNSHPPPDPPMFGPPGCSLPNSYPPPGPPKFGPPGCSPPNNYPLLGPPKFGPSGSSQNGYAPPGPPKFGPPRSHFPSSYLSFGPPKFGSPVCNQPDLSMPDFPQPPSDDSSAFLPSHNEGETYVPDFYRHMRPLSETSAAFLGARPDYLESEDHHHPFMVRRYDPNSLHYCELCSTEIPEEEYFEHLRAHEELGDSSYYSGDENDYDLGFPFERYTGRRRYIDEIDVNDYEVLMSLDQHMYDPGNGLIPEKLQHIVEVDYKGSSEVVNCLCGDDLALGQRVKYLSCAHVFHSHCIDNWLSRNAVCPIDRRPIG